MANSFSKSSGFPVPAPSFRRPDLRLKTFEVGIHQQKGRTQYYAYANITAFLFARGVLDRVTENFFLHFSVPGSHGEPIQSLKAFGQSQDPVCLIPRQFKPQGEYTAPPHLFFLATPWSREHQVPLASLSSLVSLFSASAARLNMLDSWLRRCRPSQVC
jgi:hypothetical protein